MWLILLHFTHALLFLVLLNSYQHGLLIVCIFLGIRGCALEVLELESIIPHFASTSIRRVEKPSTLPWMEVIYIPPPPPKCQRGEPVGCIGDGEMAEDKEI